MTPANQLPVRREEKFHRILLERCTEEDWVEIIEEQVVRAKRGEWRPVAWLSNYLMGPPAQVHEFIATRIEDVTVKVIYGEEQPALEAGGDVVDGEAEVVMVDLHEDETAYSQAEETA